MTKAKTRGVRRKCREMVNRLEATTQTFPTPHRGEGYWHLHLPVQQNFVDSRNTPFRLRRWCVQTLIDQSQRLISMAPVGEKTRVVAAISLPDLWNSQIVVFFGATYFASFFDRNSAEQRWDLLEGCEISKRWDLRLPDGFSERAYQTEYLDEDEITIGRIIFFGQLD